MTTHIPPPNDPIWQKYAKTDPILRDMLQKGKPLTREQWLISNYLFDGVPEPVPHETEAAMPPPFRKPYED
jgi:hypothetical protein